MSDPGRRQPGAKDWFLNFCTLFTHYSHAAMSKRLVLALIEQDSHSQEL
jgi:hypothetical protein